MGLAVPSVAEASRGLPSVKAAIPEADDEIVTSVAYQPQHADEPVSPELALVDPELAERLRPLLPEPVEEPDQEEFVAAPVEEVTEVAPEASLARAVDDAAPPETAKDELAPAAASGATVHVLPTAPQPVARVEAAPEMKTVLTVAAVAAEVEPAAPPPAASPPAASPPTSRSETLRRLLAAFGAGAVIASLVVVGVIAEMGETGPPVEDAQPVNDGSAVGTPAPAPSGLGAAPRSTPTKPKVASTKPATRSAGTKAKAAASRKSTKKSAARSTRTRAAASPARKQVKRTAPKQKAAPPAAPSRRFAWAPVEGAVGYRVELFRGDQQVLKATTKQPVYELAGRWRHQGRVERLSPGSYRWYVWPVLRSGPATQAVVQARLDVP